MLLWYLYIFSWKVRLAAIRHLACQTAEHLATNTFNRKKKYIYILFFYGLGHWLRKRKPLFHLDRMFFPFNTADIFFLFNFSILLAVWQIHKLLPPSPWEEEYWIRFAESISIIFQRCAACYWQMFFSSQIWYGALSWLVSVHWQYLAADAKQKINKLKVRALRVMLL